VETKKLSDVMMITHGTEKFVAINATDIAKLEEALNEASSKLGQGKDVGAKRWCCDWCKIRIIVE